MFHTAKRPGDHRSIRRQAPSQTFRPGDRMAGESRPPDLRCPTIDKRTCADIPTPAGTDPTATLAAGGSGRPLPYPTADLGTLTVQGPKSGGADPSHTPATGGRLVLLSQTAGPGEEVGPRERNNGRQRSQNDNSAAFAALSTAASIDMSKPLDSGLEGGPSRKPGGDCSSRGTCAGPHRLDPGLHQRLARTAKR